MTNVMMKTTIKNMFSLLFPVSMMPIVHQLEQLLSKLLADQSIVCWKVRE